jgi:hypothetical protein
LTKKQSEQDEGTYIAPSAKRFAAWADEWLKGVRGEATTRATYAVSLEYAKRAFGKKYVRQLTAADVVRVP